ncbi:efflux RND transporter permease subunit [Cardiobacterium hominis]|uniref:efflux RND transporter permease subunit n=1 Tax=Cardiobacterium hominis TaxID=2718 RepID=UPI00370D671F
MNVSAWSIRNPLVAVLLFILLSLGGWHGFHAMRVQQFPDMDFPVVVVSVALTGASPQQLESDVAKKVESRLASLDGVKNVRSTLQTGLSTTVIEFRLEKDLQEAVDEVRSAVGEIRSDLPADALDPVISKVGTSGMPLLTFSVAAQGMDALSLSWFVDDRLSRRLLGIPGVGSVSRVGGLSRTVEVLPDPVRLKALGLPISAVAAQVAALQRDVSGGEAQIGGGKQSVRALGAQSQAADIADLRVQSAGGAQRLGDFATVRDGAAEADSHALFDGETVVAFEVVRSRGASEVGVMHAIEAELARVQADFPQFRITKVYDRATPVEEDYENSLDMLVEGGLLAVVVVFVFLRNWRATLVAAVALPLSVIPAFLVMWLLGFSLNIISLLALSLVIGVLVDDAIVEIENIIRHLRGGKSPYEAAMEAADEIGLAVIATTFTLIAVFLPTAFMSGVIGQFFRQFGWTAAIAVFFSLAVARLVTPMMAAYVLKAESREVVRRDGALMRAYLAFVGFTLRWRWTTLAVTIALFVFSLSLARHLPSTFMPDDDMNQSRVSIDLTPDATLEDTLAVSEAARRAIADAPGVAHIFSSVGRLAGDIGSNGGKSRHRADLELVLAPRGTRPSKTAIERDIEARLQNVAGARFTVGLSNGGAPGYIVSLTSDNPQILDETAQALMRDIRALPNAGSVTSTKSLAREELRLYPDPLKMADRGVTTLQLADTLRIATQGDYEQRLAKLNLDSRQLPVVVRLPEAARADLATLEDLTIDGKTRVGDVARLAFAGGPATITRYERAREIMITVQVGRGALGELADAVRNTPTMQNLPPAVRANDIGQAEMMKELFSGFILAMGVGIFCIYAILVLLFHRVLQPFTILMALPLSIGGAFAGLLILGSSISMSSMIGFIMLMGIATKNSILLVDYAIIAERRDGMNRFDALIDACHKRARPIIMTSIAMGAGMTPLLLGWGSGDPTFPQPMAAAVVSGLVTSTLLSLVVIPVVYTLMDDLGRLLRRRKA